MQAIDKLIIGTAQMGLDYGINNAEGKIEEVKSFEILDAAFSLGLRELDTAELYGTAHEVIKKYHLSRENSFRVNTKFSHGRVVYGEELPIENMCIDLGVEKINCVLFHTYKDFLLNRDNLNVFSVAKEKGILKHVGVSIHSNEEALALCSEDDIDVVQLPLNLLNNKKRKEGVLTSLEESGKVIQTRSVFLQGMFFMTKFSENNVSKNLKMAILDVQRIAQKEGLSIEQLAMSYVFSQPEVNKVVVGVDNWNQLKRNIDGISKLSEKTCTSVEEIPLGDDRYLNPALW